MNKVKQATADSSPRVTVQCSEAWATGEAQDRLGTMAILRRHHHKQWYYAITRTYRKRVKPQGVDNQKHHKDKSPLELCATLIREVWRLFETVWENRNKCLHNSTGAPLAHINERPNEQLVHYKHDRKSLLTYRDRHWIEHPEHVIRSWFHKKKRQLLRLLDGWHSKHKTKTAAAIKNQKSLLEFAGFTVSHPLKRRRKICD